MPRIQISEQNFTRGVPTLGTDIPYIPGFVGDSSKASSVPVLFTSLNEFKTAIGDMPVKFAAAQSYDGITICPANSYDRSYIIAAELLNQGMPVYYHAFEAKANTTETVKTFDNIIKDNLLYGSDNFAIDATAGGKFIFAATTDLDVALKFKAARNLLKGEEFSFDCNDDTVNISWDPRMENGIVSSDDGIAKETELTITLSVTEPKVIDLADIKIGKEETTTSTSDTIAQFYADLATYLAGEQSDLADKGEYTIKYITTGGYPNVFGDNFDLATLIDNIAEARGDCVAFIEDASTSTSVLAGDGSFFKKLQDKDMPFGTAFYPPAKHTLSVSFKDGNTLISEHELPACYSYFISLAKSIKNNPNWLAIAGAGRGYVSSFEKSSVDARLSNTIADSYQPEDEGVALNAVTLIKPYGNVIWGNRTLKKITEGLDATHFLNTRNMISDIKKVCYSAARALMFEQNSQVLWLDFKGRVTPLLDRLKAGNGISKYEIIQVPGDKRQELKCLIKIYPISAVEAFDIKISITDSDVEVK